MCLAQGPQRSDAGEARTRGLSVSEFKVIFDLKSDIFLVTIILCFVIFYIVINKHWDRSWNLITLTWS